MRVPARALEGASEQRTACGIVGLCRGVQDFELAGFEGLLVHAIAVMPSAQDFLVLRVAARARGSSSPPASCGANR